MRHVLIQYLLQRYHTGRLDAAEAALLTELLLSADDDQLLTGAMETRLHQSLAAPEWTVEKQEQLLLQLRQRLSLGNNRSSGMYFRKRLYKWVAAAILLLAAVGGYWTFSNHTASLKKQSLLARDIAAPSKTTAYITLANGRQVPLDRLPADTLLLGDGGHILQSEDGRIAYTGTASSAGVNTLTVPAGSRPVALVLADGTGVWADAGSELTYPTNFTGTERSVQLSGQAYFEVARLPEAKGGYQPFIVESGNTVTEVHGTHFNINAFEDEQKIKITLLEGKVTVKAAGQTAALLPGTQAQFQPSTARLSTVQDVDLQAEMAWKNGYFAFHNADLKTVMRQLARWYNISVEFHGNLPDRRFEGEIQRDLMLSQALKILEKNNVNFQIEGKKIIVMP